jgi:internalin A
MYSNTSLIYLNFSNNEIKKINSNISKLTNLTRLDIGNNHIKEISGLSYLENLTRLSLIDNNLEDITKYLPTNLKILHLQRNNIKKIDISTLSLDSLVELNLERNKLKTNDIKSLSILTNLTILQLTSNYIDNLSDVCINMNNLVKIELGRNKFKEFPRFPYSIKSIDLRNNFISKLIIFRDYTNLNYLNLNHNKIVELNSISEKLEVLRIERNLLEKIEFGELTNLTRRFFF